jgi:N-methylhydantoinase A
MHGGVLAADLAIPTVIVPETPGVLSALGLLVANIEHERTRTLGMRAQEVTLQDLIRAFEPLEQECWRRMQADRVVPEQVMVLRSAEARYIGQSYELEVPIEGGLDHQVVARIEAAFHVRHEQVYGHSSSGSEVEIVNLRAVLVSPLPKPVLRRAPAAEEVSTAQIGVRRAYFGRDLGTVETAIYARERLPVGSDLIGPAIVEQADTTVVIYPSQRARLDQAGNLLMTPG